MKFTLSPFERLQLINQFEIRKALAKNEDAVEWFDEMIEVLEDGYESQYSRLIERFSVFTKEESTFVYDVLEMYRCIEDYKVANPDDAEVTKSPWSHFFGFDANTESRHLGFVDFLFKRKDLYTEQHKYATRDGFNSHMPTLDTYRRLLAKYNSFGKNVHELSREQVLAILGEAIHPDNRKSESDSPPLN